MPSDHEGTDDTPHELGGALDGAGLHGVARSLATAARAGGRSAVTSGRFLAEWLIDAAPRIPVRDRAVLVEQHGGRTGAALAEELIATASRATAGVGAAAGALASAEELAPPAWLALPLELAAETAAVAAIELKLVAELHEVYGEPIEGSRGDRNLALVRAWAERRGVTPTAVLRQGGVAESLGRGARNEVVRLVRRRMLRRLGANLSTLAPLLVGAVAGAEVNRRATRSLGNAVVRDLAERRRR